MRCEMLICYPDAEGMCVQVQCTGEANFSVYDTPACSKCAIACAAENLEVNPLSPQGEVI